MSFSFSEDELGRIAAVLGVEPKVVTGHDFRSISQPIKNALILGMVQGGCEVLDIGLALSPMVYWSQFELDCACCAMV